MNIRKGGAGCEDLCSHSVIVCCVAKPELQAIGTLVGQQLSATIAGQQTFDAVFEAAQTQVERDMTRSGYIN
ncbi:MULTISPECIES: hypothetical protein [Ensifer]|uniref:hypothetical protein n=1 Tax=Ensifer TaxID=106591 RepID=UPI00046D3C87|nr:hypothetical protein [Ensifer canadensis]MBD9489479.1 hypothetical protein [Ensifer sp. ENS11]MDP9632686.1 hypothetical protein [Ensifer adhaerens]NOV17792.1 hypothetical protein [Ensifer canadensis]